MDATNNWWGGVGGPKPYGTGNAAINANVEPWSDVPFTQAGAEAQAMGTDTWCGAFGEPVNTSTGAFYYSHTDVSIPTRGLPLEFARTYNSNDGNDGPLGYGWSFNWQISANPRANGDVVILRGDGRRDNFTVNQDGSYNPPPGRHDRLIKNPDGTFRLTTPEQEIYNFGANNRLASVIFATGQATTFAYDGNKRLATITEPAGRTLGLTYTPDNRIDEISDPQGNTVSFGYSSDGNLIQVTDQNGGVTAYSYDTAHRITAITDPNGNSFVNNTYDAEGKVVEQTDAEGNLITFVYDPANHITTMTRQMDPGDPSKDQVTVHHHDSQLRLIKEIDPYGIETLYTYDAAGNRDSVTDRRGVTARTIYDAYGNVTDLYEAYGRPEQQHTGFTYNSTNRPLSMTDARGYTINYTYDATGVFPVLVTYPQVTSYDGTYAGYTEVFSYNADGTLATSTDRNGDVTSYTYDGFGGLDLVTKNTNRPPADQVTINYDFDSLGRKTVVVDGNGHQTSYEYSPIGDLRFTRTTVTNPETQLQEAVVTEYRYDGNGNKTAAIDPEGKMTSYAYTPMDNLRLVTDARLNTIEHTYDAAYNRMATKDRNGNWTHFIYDKNNKMVSATDPEGNITAYTLDEEGNPVSETDPLGRTTSRTFDGLGQVTAVTEPDEGGAFRTTTFTYDAAGNLIATTDPAGHTYTQTFDELSRLKAATDPLGNSVYHRYDGDGNRIRSKDQRGYETSFAYSPNDWLTTVTDPLSSTTTYTYDKNGNLISQTDAEGRTTLYGYDELSRLASEKVDAGGGSYLLERSYAYDKAGNLRKDTTGEGAISYTYDAVYNTVGITDRQGATYSFTYDNNQNQLTAREAATQRTVSFSYNSRGLLAASTDALGAQESFTYDGTANLVQRNDTVAGQNFTTTFSHTPRNQVKSVTRGSDTTSFTFDAAGNLAAKTYPNGVNTSYSYDDNGRSTALQSVKDGQTLQSYSQNYDTAGNITSITENGSLITDFAYDQLNRLTAEDIGGYGLISYTYDRVGNRLTLSNPTSGLTTYSYNQANQLTQFTNGQDTTDFTYNTNGALAQKATGQDTTAYIYSGLDKLTQVTTPTTTVTYAYDALGRRIQRSEGADTRSYHLNGKSDLEDYQTDAAGSLTSAALRGADGLISETDHTGPSPATSYHLYSPHGDTAALTDQSGAVTASYRYDSFGNAINGTSPRNGYTGKWQRDTDNATSTIRMGVREYDPALGRFISPDTLKGTPTDPQQRNRYTYTSNNPLTRYDLSGNTWYKPWTWFGDEEEEASAEESTDVVQNSGISYENYGSLYSDQERMRFGAGGNGYAECKYSNRNDLENRLLNTEGKRIIDKFGIVRTGEFRYGVQIFVVTSPDRWPLTTSARNPYLDLYANTLYNLRLSIYASGLMGAHEAVEAFRGEPGIPGSKGAETISILARRSREIFDKMVEWEQCCGIR